MRKPPTQPHYISPLSPLIPSPSHLAGRDNGRRYTHSGGEQRALVAATGVGSGGGPPTLLHFPSRGPWRQRRASAAAAAPMPSPPLLSFPSCEPRRWRSAAGVGSSSAPPPPSSPSPLAGRGGGGALPSTGSSGRGGGGQPMNCVTLDVFR